MQVISPFVVGRDTELQTLDTGLAGARHGRGASLFVTGEPGIGKSRLISETVSRAFAAGIPVLRGRATPTSVLMPFRPITEALFSLFRAEGPRPDPTLAPYRPALARLVPEWRTGEPNNTESLVVLAEAVLRLLATTGRQHGCLLVLEDLHDADAETLAVVEYLVDNLLRQPVLLVASLRPDPGPATDLARRTGQRNAATLMELPPLGPDQVRQLAAACLRTVPDALPRPLVDRLIDNGDGNPLVVEELLRGALAAGVLVCADSGGCQLVGELGDEVPTSLVRNVTPRADRLGEQGRELLNIAAVLGRRFNVSVVQAVSGLDDRTLLRHLAAATDAQLIVPDGAAPDWYNFRHALTAEALLASLMPIEVATIAHRAADVLTTLKPELPGEWCQLAGRLRATAGDGPGAGLHFAEAGRRALADGATASAIALLDRARELLPATTHGTLRAEVLESLVYALAEAGQLDRAFEVTSSLSPTAASAPGPDRRVALHTRLAWGAVQAGRWDAATVQVAAARARLGPTASAEESVEVDVVEAHLMVEGQAPGPDHGPDRIRHAEEKTLRAVEVAERIPSPVAACQGWQLLAMLARHHSFDQAEVCLNRMLAVAQTHSLPIWRVHAMLRLGINQAMRTGTTTGLEQALRDAQASGAIALSYTAESSMAMEAVLRGEYSVADEISRRCVAATARFRYLDDHQYNLLIRAMVPAHQGDRAEMERQLAEFQASGGEDSLHLPVSLGLCRAFCALLEEDHPLALAELDRARAWEERNPNIYYLAGRYGLGLLLDVLHGRGDRRDYQRIIGTPGAGLRWNQQFLGLADAVLLGRAGRPAEAEAAVARAHTASARYPRAHHLGLRLVAEAALTDGWGDPIPWLRTAEEHFHLAGLPVVASACRALLRRGGASAPQRRSGRNQIPAALLSQGLTVREYEVLVLLRDRHGNKEIAQRLFISPRTVEKHVANLLTKTGCDSRVTLRGYAEDVLAAASPTR